MTAPVTSGPSTAKTARAWLDWADRVGLVSGIFLVLPLLWVVAYFFPPINQDVGVILAITERWMSGERLYLDVIDVNPPLIFMLTLIPVALAKVLPLSGVTALTLCVMVLAAWSVWASYRMIVALAVTDQVSARLFLLPLLLFDLIVFPSEMFAQREHLMALGMIPYALLAALRCAGKPVSRGFAFSTAIIAALGFALKPHFLLVPLALELHVLFVRGWRVGLADPVPWIMGAVMAGYAALAWFLMPAYFDFVLPLVLSSYEDLGGTSYFSIVTGKHLSPYLLVAIPLTIVAFVRRWPHVMRLTGIAALVTALVGVSQDKGWPYHLLPAQMAAILLFGWAVARMTDPLQSGGEVVARTGRVLIGLILLLVYSLSAAARFGIYDQLDYETSQAGQWQRILERHANNATVLMLTPGIYPHFPAMNYVNIKEASRFLTVWPLQGAYEGCKPEDPRYHTAAEMTEGERLFNRMLIEDLVKNKPRLVVIDRIPGIPWCGGKEFSFLEYYLMQPDFAAEWENYDYTAVYDRYYLYTRKGAPPVTPPRR